MYLFNYNKLKNNDENFFKILNLTNSDFSIKSKIPHTFEKPPSPPDFLRQKNTPPPTTTTTTTTINIHIHTLLFELLLLVSMRSSPPLFSKKTVNAVASQSVHLQKDSRETEIPSLKSVVPLKGSMNLPSLEEEIQYQFTSPDFWLKVVLNPLGEL